MARTDTAVSAETGMGLGTVDRLLNVIGDGAGVPVDLFAQDAVLDATVPGWRFTVRGPSAMARQYSGWFAVPAVLEELERHPVLGGEVVRYLLTWIERGIPHAAHHCHILRFAADGRIVADTFFCGGRWDAGLLARMAAENDAG